MKGQGDNLPFLRRLSTYILRNSHLLSLSVACMIISTYLNVYIPQLSGKVIKNIIESESFNSLIWIVAQILIFTAILGVFSFLQRYANGYFSQKVVYEIRNDVFKAIQKQSFAFFDRMKTGQLMTRATTDVDRIRTFLGWQLTMFINSTFLIGGIIVSMFMIDPELTLIAFSFTPLIFINFYYFGGRIRPVIHRARQQFGALTSILWENITGVRVVRSFTNEDFEERKFEKPNMEYYSMMLESIKLRAVFIPLATLLGGLIMVAVYWYGGLQVINNRLTIDQLYVFGSYTTMLIRPIWLIGMFWSGYQRMAAAGTRVFEIIDAPPEVMDSPDAIELPPIKGHIIFDRVYFGYEKERPILKNINLEVKPGETVALLGPTGSGKSTIIQLLPRFYDVSSGRILIDGYDIRKVKLKSLRRQIGIISQESFLFNTTIKENIAFGKPNATMKEIIDAAKKARAHDFIIKLPKGYNTIVGEKGVNLSGGQQQRIAIARAILMNPRILIMDDSTSNIDVDTEYEIQQALSALLKDRTTFVVTHRISTIRNADRIVVLENGEIVEEGTHESLMAKRGVYYKIYRSLSEEQREIPYQKIGSTAEGRG